MTESSSKRKIIDLVADDTKEGIATNIKRLATGMKYCMEQIDSLTNISADCAEAIVAFKERVDELENRTRSLDHKLEAVVKTSNCVEEDFDDDDDDEESLSDTKDPWTIMFLKLRTYRIIQGDCRVPPRGSNAKLSTWVKNQKTHYNNTKTGKKPKMNPGRIIMLDGIGFNWGGKYPPPPSWGQMFEDLQKYQKKCGHCNIRYNKTNPNALAKWIAQQRIEHKRFRKSKDTLLDPEQIGKLDGIGMKWKEPK